MIVYVCTIVYNIKCELSADMTVKYGQILSVVVLGIFTVGSISVMGLLQSTERIGTSGLIVRPADTPIIIPPRTSGSPLPPPPEPEIEIDIYSNQACTSQLTDVEWGEIEAGGDSNSVIYVKNNGDMNVVISLATENWSSSTASNNMELSWDYSGSPISSGDVRQITLTLSVDPDCPELSSFGFNIVIIGS